MQGILPVKLNIFKIKSPSPQKATFKDAGFPPKINNSKNLKMINNTKNTKNTENTESSLNLITSNNHNHNHINPSQNHKS